MEPTATEGRYPLSSMQQGLLFHSLYDKRAADYIQQLECRLLEPLNVPAFKSGWRQLTARHDVLRTCFQTDSSEGFVQVVKARADISMEEEDWRGFSASDQEQRLEDYLRSDRQRGFEPGEELFTRLALFQVADAEYWLIWTSHHALLDGRSRLILIKELFAFYEANRRGQDLSLPHPRPFSDYIGWLKHQNLHAAEAFWREMLCDFSTPTALVEATVVREEVSEDKQETQTLQLDARLTSCLQSLARQHAITLNTILQGCWAILLSRYCGEDDVLFGATRACRRTLPGEAESMVGLFINTLPVRTRVRPDAMLLTWLKELRAQSVAVHEFEHTPLVNIQSWSGLPRGRQLFESILVFENYLPDSALKRLGDEWGRRHFKLHERTNYPLTLTAYAESELLLKISYRRGRFNSDAVASIMRSLSTLLKEVAANPQRRLADLSLMSEPERAQVLVEWNDTAVSYPEKISLHALFEEQVYRTPDAIALVCGTSRVTFQELNERANRLARHLRKLGVRPEVKVAILLERCVDMVVAVLATLKAGGAYVPLDLAYPGERLRFILDDAEVQLLVTHKQLSAIMPGDGITIVDLDQAAEVIGSESGNDLPCELAPGNLAYVIYTSGSTGKPKGVAIEHRQALAFLQWVGAFFSPQELSGVLASTSICFDLSVFELFAPLSWGGTVILVDNAFCLPEAAVRHQVTLINTVPSVFGELLALANLPPSVTIVNLAGEALPVKLVRRAYEQRGVKKVFNLYGPSEDTTYSTCAVLEKCDSRKPVIGRPISNTQVYILDADLQPVPVGVIGELYLGGAGLARGYLRRPGLTAQRFLPNAFATKPGARIYRTGDLARYRRDGQLEFLGRVDHQLKLRGFRIEPGEIEAALLADGAVREAVVESRAGGEGGPRLVAYISGSAIDVERVLEDLRRRLPAYMVPTAVVVMDQLPRSPNGKIERRKLPEPKWGAGEGYAAPRNAVEEVLASIWEKLLGAERIGTEDNFVEIGGHSLLAAKVVARVRQMLSVDLTLSSVFQYPTVAQLAQSVIAHEQEAGQTEKIARLIRQVEAMSAEDTARLLKNGRRGAPRPAL